MTIPRTRGLGLLLLALYASATTATNILPAAASASFPQCGLSCTALTQAQGSCESAAQATWVSCFCQSALLTTLKTSGSVCTSCTAPADQSLLSTWYNNYCNSNGQDTSNAGSSTNTAATTTATVASASTSGGKSASSKSTSEVQPSWYVSSGPSSPPLVLCCNLSTHPNSRQCEIIFIYFSFRSVLSISTFICYTFTLSE